MAPTLVEKLDRAAAWIAHADALLITAGAGTGVESGLPAFRGRRGLWKVYSALKHLNMDFSRISTEKAMRTAPRLAWGFYGHLLQRFRQTNPHAGFQILLRRAGRMKINDIPACPRCGHVARPNMLLFDDYHWIKSTFAAQRGHWRQWCARVKHPAMVELGASKAIPTVRHFTEVIGRRIIRINPHHDRITYNQSVGMAGSTLDMLQLLDARLQTGGDAQTQQHPSAGKSSNHATR